MSVRPAAPVIGGVPRILPQATSTHAGGRAPGLLPSASASSCRVAPMPGQRPRSGPCTPSATSGSGSRSCWRSTSGSSTGTSRGRSPSAGRACGCSTRAVAWAAGCTSPGKRGRDRRDGRQPRHRRGRGAGRGWRRLRPGRPALAAVPAGELRPRLQPRRRCITWRTRWSASGRWRSWCGRAESCGSTSTARSRTSPGGSGRSSRAVTGLRQITTRLPYPAVHAVSWLVAAVATRPLPLAAAPAAGGGAGAIGSRATCRSCTTPTCRSGWSCRSSSTGWWRRSRGGSAGRTSRAGCVTSASRSWRSCPASGGGRSGGGRRRSS